MSSIMFRDTERALPRTTREGLQAFLTRQRPQVIPLTRAAYEKLSAAEKADYNRTRLVSLSAGLLVRTPQVSAAEKEIVKLMNGNVDDYSPSTGLIISGDATLGKSTIAELLMRRVFMDYRRQNPRYLEHGRVPVVYIVVPTGCTPKLLMVAFARFFGLTVGTTENADSIKHRVIHMLRAAHTQLVVIDEVHNLQNTNRGNGESINVLKQLHDDVPATYVYAGVKLAETALLAGTAGEQLTGRFIRTELTRYNLSDTEQKQTWAGIVKSFESALPLFEHTPGSLAPLNGYLRERTNGSIGSLWRLLKRAATMLVDSDGPETITQELLDGIVIDMAAEQHYARKTTTPKNKKVA